MQSFFIKTCVYLRVVQKAPFGRLLYNGSAAAPHVVRSTPFGRPSHNMRLGKIPKKNLRLRREFFPGLRQAAEPLAVMLTDPT